MPPRDDDHRKSAMARLRALLSMNDAPLSPMEAVRKRYVRTRRDATLLGHFDRLLLDLAERPEADDPDAGLRREGNLLLVMAMSGAGKTRSLNRLFGRHPALDGRAPGEPGCPVLSLSAPSPCGVKELGRSVLAATGYPLSRRNLDGPEIWAIVRGRLEALGILVIHIDEAQHATQLRDAGERQKLRNTVKALMVDPAHPVAVILSGLPEIAEFLEPDVQLSRRAQWYSVAPVALPEDGEALRKTLSGNAELVGLALDQDTVRQLLPRLVHASDGRLGVLVEEIQDALRFALEAKAPRLLLEHFAGAFARRTGNAPAYNPYMRADFRSVEVWRMLADRERPPPVPEKGPARRGRKPGGAE